MSLLDRARDELRRRVRGVQRARQYPVCLPHHRVTEAGVEGVDGAPRAVSPGVRRALGLADGTRTLAEIRRALKVSASELIRAQDEGLVLFWPRPVPPETPPPGRAPHAVIVSPHLDDAALSCGGRMLGDMATLVVNVFSRSTWWRFGGEGEIERVLECRRAEESLVGRLTGEPAVALDLPEALLRGHAMAEVFTATPDARDAEVTEQIGTKVAAIAREHPLAHWYLPLGIGGHIDHRIARDAALAALERAGTTPTHVHFYEDLPYAAKLAPNADFAHHLPGRVLVEERLDIEDELPWKIEVLRAYASQFRWAQVAEIGAYARALGNAEVTWGLT
jgi:LmbE family N-acetylglucosaminyl deacetylase